MYTSNSLVGQNFRMLIGHATGIPTFGSSQDALLGDSVARGDSNEDEELVVSEQILYTASFQELAANTIQYDTVIWVSISLLLVLAWGFGIIMLLYLPRRRYSLRKDISSRKLYVTPSEIVYKASRPSFIPFWGVTEIEKHVPLSLVFDIVIEQGCLQAVYAIHTLRVESVAQGKVSTVDELRVQGICDPGLLRKVILLEASKFVQDMGRSWRTSVLGVEGEGLPHMDSLNEDQSVSRSPARSSKATGSPFHVSVEQRGVVPADFMLHKLEDFNKSLKKIEVLIGKSHRPATGSSSKDQV